MILCAPRDARFSFCFPAKSASFPAGKTTRDGLGPPGDRKTLKQKQHREPSPVFPIITGTVIKSEEAQTIGFGRYQQNYLTEDNIRYEHGIVPRYRGEIEK